MVESLYSLINTIVNWSPSVMVKNFENRSIEVLIVINAHCNCIQFILLSDFTSVVFSSGACGELELRNVLSAIKVPVCLLEISRLPGPALLFSTK